MLMLTGPGILVAAGIILAVIWAIVLFASPGFGSE
jgi:hypothetical protein